MLLEIWYDGCGLRIPVRISSAGASQKLRRRLRTDMKKHLLKKRIWIIPLCVLGILVLCFFLYTEQYYHADPLARAALESDATVQVKETDYGWLFDGPSERDALIFYPGAKVEETAYAPLLHLLAGEGMDVCLVKMPFRLAFFGLSKADDLIARYGYSSWYIGGHSLGGAMAANYAADHGKQLTGVVLLAAYATKKLDDSLKVTLLYGSEDQVLNRTKLKEGEQFLPDHAAVRVIEGGNHAQFGNYGEQKGDGKALISAEEQQRLTVERILQNQEQASGQPGE